jgi:acyl-coenzyme A thioesterase PaaI-like protein
MSGIPQASEEQRELLQQRQHRECIVCRPAEAGGFGIRFRTTADGGVAASFDCPPFFQGYEGVVHGGVVCTLLDAAMTHCLMARGKSGVTARLIVRFLQPVTVGLPAEITARLCEYEPPLYVLEADLVQQGRVRARATAKFIDRDSQGHSADR